MPIDRMLRAARLDVKLYEEVEADTSATSQALLVVILVAVAGGIGSFFSGGVVGLVTGIVVGVVGWAIWAFLTHLIGTKLFGGTATMGELLRTVGFAYSPGVLNILGFIPGLGALIGLVVFAWTIVAGVIAVRQALDFSTGKAIATVAISAAIVFFVVVVVSTIVGVGLVGVGAISS